MDFGRLVCRSRSHRGFDERHVIERETLRTLVGYARLSPSSANLQVLKYYLSNEEETNRLIRPHLRWAGRLKGLQLPREGEQPTAYIVILMDHEIAPKGGRFLIDVGIAAQTILLGAAEMGLGGCMIGAFDPDAVHGALGLHERLEPVLVLALGKGLDQIVIEEAQSGEIAYWRDGEDVHHVPKRPLGELIAND
jgi:nitroreductase